MRIAEREQFMQKIKASFAFSLTLHYRWLEPKIGGASAMATKRQIKTYFVCRFLAIALGLHYRWPEPKIGIASAMARKRQIKNYFVCRFLAIALTLHYLCK